MRSVRTWLRSWRRLIAIIVAIVVVVLVVVFWPHEIVTQKNFAMIRIGMSQNELYRLLGTPDYQTVETGLVNGP